MIQTKKTKKKEGDDRTQADLGKACVLTVADHLGEEGGSVGDELWVECRHDGVQQQCTATNQQTLNN